VYPFIHIAAGALPCVHLLLLPMSDLIAVASMGHLLSRIFQFE
jgi:hypothetical protein